MSKVNWIWQFSIINKLLLVIKDFWRLTIIWLVSQFVSDYKYYGHFCSFAFAFAFAVANLNLSLIFDLKGNALKDVGRVDEAIKCYNVGHYFMVIYVYSLIHSY